MKKSFIILLLSTIGYISCLININDISLSKEFIVNTDEYPNYLLPNYSTFYFRMEVNDLSDKIIEVRADEENSFVVKIASFEEKPEIEGIEWEELESQKNIYDFTYYIYHYPLKLKKNTNYILISISLKKDLNYLSIFIENDIQDENDIQEENDIQDEIISYKSKFFTEYQVNLVESQTLDFIIETTESHIGETFLNFVVKKEDTPVHFQIFAFVPKKAGEESKKNIEDYIDVKLNDIVINPENEIYKYKFDLKDNSTYTSIKVELDKKIDFSYYIDYPKKEKEIPIYNIEYSKEYEIDVKNWVPSKKDYFILKSTNKHVGETYINLKVKKGVTKDNFYLIGYGTKDYVASIEENPEEDLNIIYIKTIYKDFYDIIQYYFESKENTPFFTIKLYIYKNIDYLSFITDVEVAADVTFGFIAICIFVAIIIWISFRND